MIADRYQEGRVFIAGDAAHALPPTRGGFGANTGIADVHNLAWKLEAVLRGRSCPALLETYEAERRPVACTRLEQTFARPDYARYAKDFENVPLFDDAAMEYGQLYRSAGIVGAGDELPAAAPPNVWKGQPGTRAPHVWAEWGAAAVDIGSGRARLDSDRDGRPLDVVQAWLRLLGRALCRTSYDLVRRAYLYPHGKDTPPMTNIRVFCLLAAVCMLTPSASAPAFAQKAGAVGPPAPGVTLPSTASDHEALATKYRNEADQYRKTAAEHKLIAAEYKNTHPAPGGDPKINAWQKQMAKHCETLRKDAEKLAADADKAAEFHMLRAKELEGG